MKEAVQSINDPSNDADLHLNIKSIASEILKDPSKFSGFLEATATQLTEAREKAEELKGRNVFKRFFSSSSKDLADILLSQHNILQNFFVLLQTITFISGRNTALLLTLSDSLRKGIDLNDEEQKNLYAFAYSYLQDAIESANNEQIREEALKKVLILTSDIIRSNESTSNKIEWLTNNQSKIMQKLERTDTSVKSVHDSLISVSDKLARENRLLKILVIISIAISIVALIFRFV